jgi:hypothetical protein
LPSGKIWNSNGPTPELSFRAWREGGACSTGHVSQKVKEIRRVKVFNKSPTVSNIRTANYGLEVFNLLLRGMGSLGISRAN